MIRGIIVGDNFYQEPRTSIGRANGAHRIATLLRKFNFQVDVIDFFNAWSTDNLISLLNNRDKIDFIGLSVGISDLDIEKVDIFISLVKNKYPSVKVIAGGTRIHEKNYKDIDFYFRGFAEGAIEEIVNYLSRGKINPFVIDTIPVKNNQKIINCNKHFKEFDLSRLITEYQDVDYITSKETLTLETSRGCIFKCAFCDFPFIGKKKDDYIRYKDDIKSELISNHKKWGTTRYLVTDDTFNDNPVKVEALYEISKEIDFELELMAFARIDLLHAREGQLEKMVKSGFKGLFFGLETLNETTSKKIGKGFTGKRLTDYLEKIRKTYPNLHITTSFILGLPGESVDQFEKGIEHIVDNNLTDSISFFPLWIPIDTKMNNLSMFSANWKDYGYEIMEESEIIEYLKNKGLTDKFDYKEYIQTYYPWKTECMNFMDSIFYEKQIREKYRARLTVSGWYGFANSFCFDNLTELLKTKKNDMDWAKQKSHADRFVSTYISRKVKSGLKQQS